RLLGVQIIGPEGVERRIDVFATAMQLGAKVSDLANIDLAFTPPISTPTDPVMYTGLLLSEAIKKYPLMTPEQLNEMLEDDQELTILDEIGRASCRERVYIAEAGVSVKKVKDEYER